MYNHLFGPVPSRRLGMSLGIDLIPYKVCTLDCVYCECGATTNKTVERKEYVSLNDVKGELVRFLDENPKPDFLTFSGSGEPVLNSRIGDVLEFIKSRWPEIPAAVLTNGTLLSDPKVRRELLPADVVLPSLDAVSRGVFEKINRPHESLRVEEYIEGLIDFRREFTGRIWLEVFILPGYNNSPEELTLFGEVIQKIKPGEVQINTLDRPGTVGGLRPACREELEEIRDLWISLSGGIKVEIIAAAKKRKELTSYRKDMESAILETISRRPCTLEDLAEILGMHKNEVNKYLGVMEEEGKISAARESRGSFYRRV